MSFPVCSPYTQASSTLHGSPTFHPSTLSPLSTGIQVGLYRSKRGKRRLRWLMLHTLGKRPTRAVVSPSFFPPGAYQTPLPHSSLAITAHIFGDGSLVVPRSQLTSLCAANHESPPFSFGSGDGEMEQKLGACIDGALKAPDDRVVVNCVKGQRAGVSGRREAARRKLQLHPTAGRRSLQPPAPWT